MAIALKFTGSDEGARATAEALARSLDQLGISADNVKFNVAQKGSDNLYSSLRTLKGEAVQHERVFGFFGRQLAQTGLVARETASAMVGLGAGLASGMWVLAAVEGLQLLVQGYQALNKESHDALEKTQKDWDAFAARVAASAAELAEKVRFFGQIEGMAAYIRATDTLTAAQQRLTAATEAMNAAQDEVSWGMAGLEVAKLEKEVDKLAKTAAEAGSGLASAGQLKGLEAAEKARTEARKKAAEDWKRFQDEIVASGVKAAIEESRAEEKIRADARKKEEDDIRAWQKEIEKIEGPEAERRGEAALQEHERKRAIEQTEELALAGSLAAGAFGSIGQAIGGVAGNMVAVFGKLIQQAIQLAIAMSAQLPPPLGILNMVASAAAILATVASVKEYRAFGGPVLAGNPYIVGERGPELFVPRQGGEIVPNAGLGNVTLNFYGPTDREYFHANQANILREIRDAMRNRRG